jgi:hypothetical protein
MEIPQGARHLPPIGLEPRDPFVDLLDQADEVVHGVTRESRDLLGIPDDLELDGLPIATGGSVTADIGERLEILAPHLPFLEVSVTSPLAQEVDELIRVEIQLVVDGKEVFRLHLVVNDGLGGAERDAMAAEIAVLRVGIDVHLPVLDGEAPYASDRAQSAVVARIAVDRHPAHGSHPYSRSARRILAPWRGIDTTD